MKKLIAGFIGAFMLLMLTMTAVSALVINSWSPPISTTDAPSARYGHTTVWNETNFNDMFVWGGFSSTSGYLGTGAIYSAFDNVWYPVSTDGAPSPRTLSTNTGVWTGTEYIVWGGRGSAGVLNTGNRYNNDTGLWTDMSTTSAPSARQEFSAIWTGTEMIVWGGIGNAGPVNTGAKYNPATNSWVEISTIGAPPVRYAHTAVWTGTEMIVWGGVTRVGGVVVALNTGGRYNPVTNTWTTVNPELAPVKRGYHTALWTDSGMIVWGGVDCSVVPDCSDKPVNSGGIYDPVTNTWRPTSAVGAPGIRYGHSAVMTGVVCTPPEMVVWGGHNGATTDGALNTGAAYDPVADKWTAVSLTDAPSKRLFHRAVWTGTEMIVWGGAAQSGLSLTSLGDGKRFMP